MASGTQQQHQQQQQHQNLHQEHLMQHQQAQNNQMQFSAATPSTNHQPNANQFESPTQMHQHNTTMSPSSAPMAVNYPQGHVLSMNPHHQQQQQQLMGSVANQGILSQATGNQLASHIQQQQPQQSQQQKSQILPLLLSPRPPSLTPNSNDQLEPSENDHEQIIDQVISLENEFSDTSIMLGSVENNAGIMISHLQQQQQHQLGDINLGGGICIPDNNRFSSSSEDLLNLLIELERDPSSFTGLGNNQLLDQDEKVGIENIRKQLMSCEMQSEQQPQSNQTTNSMSPIVNQMTCQPQQPRSTQQQRHRNNVHQQQQVTPQLISQTTPVISHHQQPHQMSSSGTSQQQQHQQMSTDQPMLHGSYSNVPLSTVPVSSSDQSYTQQQHVNRIAQSNPMSIVNSSPSPSWQQPQLSPFSPQPQHNNSRTPSQRQGQQYHPLHHRQQQQHSMQQHQTTTSPQMQQLHHPLQQRSPSQSVSPPATTEPSPVVKKNPLLNAQLVNSRAPSITPTRFMNSQANVLNQNPILNAKLSQSPFTNSSGVSSPVNPSLNTQSRFIQQNQQQQSNFNYDMNQQQNAQPHATQQTGHMNLYVSSEQQQQSTNQIFRTTGPTVINAGGGASMNMANTSPSGGSNQVKQEIRRKVQQPKQQHQTTSLLKQLLSDDK